MALPAQGHYEEQRYSSEHRDLRVLSGPVMNPKGIPEAERLVYSRYLINAHYPQ